MLNLAKYPLKTHPDLPKSEWFQTIDYLATNYNVDLKGSTKYVSVEAVVQAITQVLKLPDAKPIYHLVDGHIHNMRFRPDESGYNPCVINLFGRKKPGKSIGVTPAVLAKNNRAFLMRQSRFCFQLPR